MSLPILARGRSLRLPVLPITLLLALLLGALVPALPARADDGEWTIEILSQSDSRAELRPCT